MNKKNTLKKTTKLICRSAIIIFILLPALMILMPACDFLGQCGKPGYSYYWSGCYMYVTWSCDSPCSPSTTHMTLHATASPQNSPTVSCKGDYESDSSGTYLQYYKSGCP
jgi:hypothetical protein